MSSEADKLRRDDVTTVFAALEVLASMGEALDTVAPLSLPSHPVKNTNAKTYNRMLFFIAQDFIG